MTNESGPLELFGLTDAAEALGIPFAELLERVRAHRDCAAVPNLITEKTLTHRFAEMFPVWVNSDLEENNIGMILATDDEHARQLIDTGVLKASSNGRVADEEFLRWLDLYGDFWWTNRLAKFRKLLRGRVERAERNAKEAERRAEAVEVNCPDCGKSLGLAPSYCVGCATVVP